MHADYIANPLYDNNPFIEALPPMLSGRDLIHALAVIPPYSDSDRDRSTGERLQLLSSLYEFYQPLSMTIDLYCEIYTAMQHCYGQYSIQSEAAAMQNGYSLMHGNALAASVGGGNSFSVIGVSGLGKSTALQRVLSLFPQVIEHTSYHGQNFYCHQIPYLVVQTPHDASIKALILDIYLQIDSLVGTSYQKDALSRRLSIDVLVSQLNQIVRVNHIGLLVIDELQNIAYIPTADLSTKQLHATLCSKSVAPRYVLQLAVLLGLSLHDLLHAPDAVPDYKAEMKAMYQSGASMYHIAQLYGIDAKTVARWIVPLQPFRVNVMVTRMFDFSPVVAKYIADCARTKLLGTRHHNHSLLVGGHAPSDCGLKCTAKASSTFSLHLLCHTRYGSFPGNSYRPCGLTLPKGRDPSGLPAADKTRLPSVRGRGPHRDDFSSSLPL